MGVGGQHHVPAVLSLERPCTLCTGGWVGLRTGLDGCGKSRPPLGFDPRTVQPVASRYTDCAIPAPIHIKCLQFSLVFICEYIYRELENSIHR